MISYLSHNWQAVSAAQQLLPLLSAGGLVGADFQPESLPAVSLASPDLSSSSPLVPVINSFTLANDLAESYAHKLP